MSAPFGVLQVALKADDLDVAEAFYRDLLAAEPAARFEPPGLLFFRLGETRLLLERGAPNGLVYFRVTGLRSMVERLRAAGVPLEGEPHVIFRHVDDALGAAGHEELQAFVRDPSGNLLGLIELVPIGD